MGNIFSDITEDINLKPTKSKILLKWVIKIGVALIVLAFGYGQYKVIRLNKMAEIEKATIELKQQMETNTKVMVDGFKAVNGRIDKVYDDGIKEFDNFQIYNKKQLVMIIDYGQTNKSLLKQMLELNSAEKSKSVESNLEKAKTFSPVIVPDTSSIVIKKIDPKTKK
jgi:hypothetical protein